MYAAADHKVFDVCYRKMAAVDAVVVAVILVALVTARDGKDTVPSVRDSYSSNLELLLVCHVDSRSDWECSVAPSFGVGNSRRRKTVFTKVIKKINKDSENFD